MPRLIHGDCLVELPKLVADGVRFDAVVTDPPYELGFMGRKWDSTGIAARPETWRAVFDTMKPGAHLVAFGGTRTYHRMVCAIEDAGFEIRDCLSWMYGSGFPKSHNLSGDRQGWGTALKPAMELICLARKPLIGTVVATVLKHGTGAINIDACRVESGGTHGSADSAGQGSGRATANRDGSAYGNGLGGIVAPPHALGRWPANVLTDGSPEVLAAFAAFGESKSTTGVRDPNGSMGYHGGASGLPGVVGGHVDAGSPARFFFSAKADAEDRAGSKHPTVKPRDLMRWLVRLVTPPGGHILDCFAGSGTTGEATMLEGFDCTMIERDDQHAADIRHRIARWSGLDAPLFADVAD